MYPVLWYTILSCSMIPYLNYGVTPYFYVGTQNEEVHKRATIRAGHIFPRRRDSR